MTPEEFFAWENEQPERHEFIDGEIYAMTGGTKFHNEIVYNLNTALRARLKGRGCHVFQENIKVQADSNSFYPDIVVECGPRDGISQLATHPVLIAEVLSSSTAYYDEYTKWPLYQRIPSLQTFLLVAQDRLLVQHYRRHGSGWLYFLHTTFDEHIQLSEPALTLPVRELYAGIDGIDPALPPA